MELVPFAAGGAGEQEGPGRHPGGGRVNEGDVGYERSSEVVRLVVLVRDYVWGLLWRVSERSGDDGSGCWLALQYQKSVLYLTSAPRHNSELATKTPF